VHYKDIKGMTSDLLRLDSDNFANPVSRIHNEVTGGEWHLFRIHVRLSQTIRPELLERVSRSPQGCKLRDLKMSGCMPQHNVRIP
jgi:hypothetical protein